MSETSGSRLAPVSSRNTKMILIVAVIVIATATP